MPKMNPSQTPPGAKTPDSEKKIRLRRLDEAGQYLGMGLGVGALGVLSATVVGVTCPACVVAAPALLGMGVYKRWQARKGAATPPAADAQGEDGANADATRPEPA